jgi:predicted RecB family nuclease
MHKMRGLGESVFGQLTDAGLTTVEAIADAEVEDLAAAVGASEKKAKQLKYAAMQWVKYEEETRAEADELGVTVVDGIAHVPGTEEEEEDLEAEAAGSDGDVAVTEPPTVEEQTADQR